ncbi:MAG TPA: SRPBCC domain-containing protein [Vicinamibacterales bacterium]|nr:SRPBCC domain-containing protein [Vicinamibacterales bacterium]
MPQFTDPRDHPQVAQTRRTFSLLCRVEVSIQSSTERIWTLLTDAKDFPRWNSTVTTIDGEIRDGQRIRIHVPGTDRTFTPVISNVVPNVRMTWTGGLAPVFKGVRTFELTPHSGGSTTFAMQERFSGLMLPILGRAMPDLGPVFERYAADLKHEAERTNARR